MCCCLELHILRQGLTSLEYYTATDTGTLHDGYCYWTFDLLIEETTHTLHIWSNAPKSWLITKSLPSQTPVDTVFTGTDGENPDCPTTANLPSGWDVGGGYTGEFQSIKVFECATDSPCDCLNGTLSFAIPE